MHNIIHVYIPSCCYSALLHLSNIPQNWIQILAHCEYSILDNVYTNCMFVYVVFICLYLCALLCLCCVFVCRKRNSILCVITCTNCMVWLTIKFTLTLTMNIFKQYINLTKYTKVIINCRSLMPVLLLSAASRLLCVWLVICCKHSPFYVMM